MKTQTLAVLSLLAVGTVALAELPAPKPDELKRTIDYYYNANGRPPVLVELKVCRKVDTAKDSKTKSECLDEIAGPIPKNTNVHAWTMWFVPENPLDGGYADATIEFVYEGEVKTSIDIPLTPSFRTRTYRANTLSKSGKWEVRVKREGKVLSSVPVTVQ